MCYTKFMLSTCYVPDNPWLASLHTTSRDQGQVGANSSRKYSSSSSSSSSPCRHHTRLSELRGKKQQQPTIYNLAWRDAHARTSQESHLACAMRDPCRVRRAPSQPTGSYNIYVRLFFSIRWLHGSNTNIFKTLLVLYRQSQTAISKFLQVLQTTQSSLYSGKT